MVDPIGMRPPQRIAPVAVGAVTAANRVRTGTAGAAPGAVSREMAATPPVDAERVAKIRRAIAEGRFPILPATIADRLLALKLDWNPNDPA